MINPSDSSSTSPPSSNRTDRLTPPLSRDELDAIVQFDTCTIANAIETFNIRLRNEGFTQPGLRCLTTAGQPVIGYAATCHVRSSDPPLSGGFYFDRTDWWHVLEELPAPRFAVIEDLDNPPGTGAAIGEVHTSILQALQCVGAATNGAVRDLGAVTAMEFPLFACNVSVSHAYVHMTAFGRPVNLLGLQIRPADLVMADCHGLLQIPLELARHLPAAAEAITRKERTIIDLCRSREFSIDKLKAAVRSIEP